MIHLRAFSDRLRLVALLILLIVGCGKSSLQTVPVSGRITLNKGDWPKPGMLYLSPIEPIPGYLTKRGTAKFGTDGNFTVRTEVDGDGFVQGKYHVNVECFIVQPSADPTAPPGKSAVPAGYQSGLQSGFIVDVPADAKQVEVNFDVPTE